jgi:hypothetical protein
MQATRRDDGDARFAASQATRWVLASSSMDFAVTSHLQGSGATAAVALMQRSTSNQAMQLTAVSFAINV